MIDWSSRWKGAGILMKHAACLALFLASGTALSVPEEGSAWQEEALVLPRFPIVANGIAVDPGPAVRHAYFVDPESVSVGGDGVVRYSLIIRSSSGVESHSYEGIRCATGERRIYATGTTSGGAWVPARQGGWSVLRINAANPIGVLLYTDFFCPERVVVFNREEALRNLRRGGHSGLRLSP